MKSHGVTIQMNFPVVLFIMMYKVVLTIESVDEILWCDHSNDISFVELLHSTSQFLGFYKKERNVQFCEFFFYFRLKSQFLLTFMNSRQIGCATSI